MKTTNIMRIFAAAAAALGLLVSCQRQEAESANTAGEDLVPVRLTATYDTETKVSYTETTTGGIKLQPAWKVGDEVIGFDGANNTYMFTVSEVDATGTATLDGECPASCTLHLIYLCGASASSISSGSLSVSYANQAGTGSTDNVYTMPAVMLADGTVTSGSGDFDFSNAGAVIGVKAVRGVPSGSTVSGITVSGENLSAATIALDGSSLKLTATTDDDDAISTATLSGVTVTDADGTLSKLVLIAVPADAKVSKVTAAVGGTTYSFKLAKSATLAAGKYSYINGSQTFTEDINSVSSISLPTYNGDPFSCHSDPVNGLFSVSPTKTVYFSPGNLYWDGSEFKFEEHQYDSPTSWDANHVGQFFWSVDASVARANNYISQEPHLADVFFTNATANPSTPNPEFTVNGETGKWMTLSIDEWQYLCSYHNDYADFRNDTRSGLYAIGITVAGKTNCVILYPDGYNKSKVVSDNDTTSYDTEEEWAVAEAEGVICLPPALHLSYSYGYSYYWCGEPLLALFEGVSDDLAHLASFSSGGFYASTSNYSSGFAVRLVTEIE